MGLISMPSNHYFSFNSTERGDPFSSFISFHQLIPLIFPYNLSSQEHQKVKIWISQSFSNKLLPIKNFSYKCKSCSPFWEEGSDREIWEYLSFFILSPSLSSLFFFVLFLISYIPTSLLLSFSLFALENQCGTIFRNSSPCFTT